MTDEIVSRTDAETLSESEMIFTCAMDIGERMLCSGAEVNRVEDTVSRICRTYGMTVDIFSITSLIIATVRTPENRVLTQTRRDVAKDMRRAPDCGSGTLDDRRADGVAAEKPHTPRHDRLHTCGGRIRHVFRRNSH